jgi:hypothetical protein
MGIGVFMEVSPFIVTGLTLAFVAGHWAGRHLGITPDTVAVERRRQLIALLKKGGVRLLKYGAIAAEQVVQHGRAFVAEKSGSADPQTPLTLPQGQVLSLGEAGLELEHLLSAPAPATSAQGGAKN